MPRSPLIPLTLFALCGTIRAQECVWTQVTTATAPSPRHDFAVAYDSARARLILFGGTTSWGGVPNGETWEWNGSAWTQFLVPGPSPRYGHAMAFHAARGVTVMFGGSGGDQHVWTWNGVAWTPLTGLTVPVPSQHSIAYDTLHARCIMFGGAGDNLTRELTADGSWATLSIASASSPPARASAASAYDSDRARIILFGGYGSSGPLGDVWEFDGSGTGSWQSRGTAMPGRADASLAYDPVRRRAILHGGSVYAAAAYPGPLPDFSEAWEFDPASGLWTRRADDGPGFRHAAAMWFDAASSRTLLFGGLSTPVNGDFAEHADLWSFDGSHPSAIIITQQSPPYANLASGQTLTLSVASTGASTFQWFSNGNPLENGGSVSGAQSPSLTINPVTTANRGRLDLALTGPCSSATRSFSLSVEDPDCPANCDHSTIPPTLNVNDFQCFLNKYAAGDSYANCDGSTIIPILNANDFQCFLERYASGC